MVTGILTYPAAAFISFISKELNKDTIPRYTFCYPATGSLSPI